MRVLEGFDRLPPLARLLVWGAMVWVARDLPRLAAG
jgi:hypothetical protein